MTGLVVIQHMFDLTDKDTLANIATDVKWQYALNIDNDNIDCLYISPKTFHSFRHLMAEYNITEEALKLVTVSLAKQMNINLDQQRLDSVHIKSNMKKLSHLRNFVKVISNFIRYLSQKKDLTECYKQINPEVIERYYPVKEDRECNPYFGQIKPSEHDRRLSEATNDLYGLVKMFDNNSAIIMLKQYKQMFRVLNDQCEFNSNDSTLENELTLFPDLFNSPHHKKLVVGS